MENQDKVFNELCESNRTNQKIIQTLLIGKEDQEWEKSDYYQFFSKCTFKVLGLVFAGALIFVPGVLKDNQFLQNNSQLLVGAGIGLLGPICLENGHNPSNKKQKKS